MESGTVLVTDRFYVGLNANAVTAGTGPAAIRPANDIINHEAADPLGQVFIEVKSAKSRI